MKKITTSSVIATSVLGMSFLILILTLCGFAKCSVETQTQIVSICSMVITTILAFYYGASHQKKQDDLNINTDDSTMNKYVFWDIQSLQDVVLKVNGVAMSPTRMAQDMKNYNSSYAVVPDDAGAQFLMLTAPATATLEFSNYSSTGVIADFIGNKPRRPK